jgi:hypothetical protein
MTRACHGFGNAGVQNRTELWDPTRYPEGLTNEPNAAAPPEVSYPRAVDQFPTPEREATGRRWVTALQDSLALVAVVWSIPAAIVIVAIPIALVVALLIWVGRFV